MQFAVDRSAMEFCECGVLIVTYFLMLGILSAVQFLQFSESDGSLMYSWLPPFTLDIDRIEEDIEGYCVDAVNSVTLATLLYECGVNTTEYIYPIPPLSWCFITLFTVTPINIVGRGVTSTVSYFGTDRRK